MEMDARPISHLSKRIRFLCSLCSKEEYKFYYPELDKTVFDTRVDSVHKGINLPEIYNGTDVIIGITDWGFDYAHPMFYDTLLTQTRIIAAWDQAKTSGPAPSGHSFGTEYASETE
jgi:minor extracellular serine protease Vpr